MAGRRWATTRGRGLARLPLWVCSIRRSTLAGSERMRRGVTPTTTTPAAMRSPSDSTVASQSSGAAWGLACECTITAIATSSNHASGVTNTPTVQCAHGWGSPTPAGALEDLATRSELARASGTDHAPDAACSSGTCSEAASRVRRRCTHSGEVVDSMPGHAAHRLDEDRRSGVLRAGGTRAASTAARAGDDNRMGATGDDPVVVGTGCARDLGEAAPTTAERRRHQQVHAVGGCGPR